MYDCKWSLGVRERERGRGKLESSQISDITQNVHVHWHTICTCTHIVVLCHVDTIILCHNSYMYIYSPRLCPPSSSRTLVSISLREREKEKLKCYMNMLVPSMIYMYKIWLLANLKQATCIYMYMYMYEHAMDYTNAVCSPGLWGRLVVRPFQCEDCTLWACSSHCRHQTLYHQLWERGREREGRERERERKEGEREGGRGRGERERERGERENEF